MLTSRPSAVPSLYHRVLSPLPTPVCTGGGAVRSVRSLQRVSQLRKTKPTCTSAFESDETCLLQRMEAQYAMQRQVRYDLPLLALCVCADKRFALAQADMIPLMMDRYKPTGWLYVAECPFCE